MNALLFDIGGTKMRVAITRDGRRFEKQCIVPTPYSFSRGMETLTRLAREIAGSNLTAVAGGIAGSHDRTRDTLTQSPLRGWVGKPLRRELRKRFPGARLLLENDTALVGLGEAVHGAGRGHRIIAYVTVSSGVGGVRIVNGRIDANAHGFEPGHHIIDFRGERCRQCGHPGDLQSFIGGKALEKRYGRKPETIRDRRVWRAVAETLAAGLVNVSVFWSPDVIVLGGSVMKSIPFSEVHKRFRAVSRIPPNPPKLLRATLGDVGGLWGAMELVKSEKLIVNSC